MSLLEPTILGKPLRSTVRSFCLSACFAGLQAGGTDEGPPGERINYGAGYFGAYLRDPDGNKVHIAQRGDLTK